MLSTNKSVGFILGLMVAAAVAVFVVIMLQAMMKIPLLMGSVSWNWAMA